MVTQEFLNQLKPVWSALAYPDIRVHPDFSEGVPPMAAGYSSTYAKHVAALVFNSSVGMQARVFIANDDPFSTSITEKTVEDNVSNAISGPKECVGLVRRHYQVDAGELEGFGQRCRLLVPENPTPELMSFRPLRILLRAY